MNNIFSAQFYPGNPFGTHFVPPVGSPNASIVIIGEAPGEKEDEAGIPFIGGAGKILNSALRYAGIDRDTEVYLTNVYKYHPPKNNIKSPNAVRAFPAFQKALMDELKQLKPKVIVPTGNTALQALGFYQKIGDIRGTILPSAFGKVIPTFHPAYILRQYHELFTLQRDFLKIRKHSRGGTIPLYREHFNLTPTLEDVQMFTMNIMERLKAGVPTKLAIDIETYIGDQNLIPIKIIGMSVSSNTAIVVPFITQSGNLYWKSREQAIQAIQAIGALTEDPRLEKMGQNLLFDIHVMMNHGFDFKGPIYDTMLGQYLVYHPSPHDLAYIASIYTEYPQWKLDKAYDDIEFRKYNARDCIILHMIRPGLDEDMQSNKVRPVFDNLMKIIIPTCRMMNNGVAINIDKHREVASRLEARLQEILDQIRVKTNDHSLNINSPKQMAELLFVKMKLKSDVKTDKGDKSTAEKVLNRLAIRYPNNEVVQLLLEHRKVVTQYNNFIKKLSIHEDGRIRAQFQLHTAVTGRFTVKDPPLHGLPKRSDKEGYIRGMYEVPKGRILIALDYSQVELMIFAVLAGDLLWLDAFKSGKDVHAINAEGLIGYYDPKYRTFIKNFIYGFIYGSEGGEIEAVAPKELIQQISIRGMLENLAGSHPWLFKYREMLENQMNKQHYIMNAYGRKRWFFPNRQKDGTYAVSKADLRAGYNFPIQSTSADIMHEKFPQIDDILDHRVDKVIIQWHDAYWLETDKGREDHLIPLIKNIMEEPVTTPLGYKFDILKVEAEIGTSLSDKEMLEWHKQSS
jgi:uracil-DNA glycosylase family 4